MIYHFPQFSQLILQDHHSKCSLWLISVVEWSRDTHDLVRRTRVTAIIECIVSHVEDMEGPRC